MFVGACRRFIMILNWRVLGIVIIFDIILIWGLYYFFW